MSQGPGVVGAVSVDRVSATVPVADPIVAPATPGPHRVHRLDSGSGGNLVVVDPLTVQFDAPAPLLNSAVEIAGVALRIVLADPANVAERRVLNEALPATITGKVAWVSRPLGLRLGVWPGSFGETTLIYDADSTGGVPGAIDIGIKDGADALVLVRKVTAAATELLMAGGPLPGNKATPYDIERLVVVPGVDVSPADQATSDAAVLAGPVDAQLQANPQPALQILQTTGATATQPGPALLSNVTVTAAGEIVIAPPASLVSQIGPVPSQPIVLAWPTGTTANTALALVRAVRLIVTLDRSIAAAVPARRADADTARNRRLRLCGATRRPRCRPARRPRLRIDRRRQQRAGLHQNSIGADAAVRGRHAGPAGLGHGDRGVPCRRRGWLLAEAGRRKPSRCPSRGGSHGAEARPRPGGQHGHRARQPSPRPRRADHRPGRARRRRWRSKCPPRRR